MQLNPGEVKCNECNGIGTTLHDPYSICNKCHGTGKLDWIENIVGKLPKPKSILDRINVRRLIIHIENQISECFLDTIPTAKNKISVYLKTLKSRRIIYDFNIVSISNNNIDIMIHPNLTTEIIRINTRIQK